MNILGLVSNVGGGHGNKNHVVASSLANHSSQPAHWGANWPYCTRLCREHLLLFLRLTTSNSPKLPLILATHQSLVPSTFASLPEAVALLANNTTSAEAACLHGIVLFPTAPPTYHAIRPFLRMIFCCVMALVAWVNLAATRETKPSVGAFVVRACTPIR
jgi:hypothetical protein